MNISPTVITDNRASELSWRLVMINSLLVGYTAHGILCNIGTDYRALMKKAAWPEKLFFNTARFFGMTFLVTSLVILELPAHIHNNCHRDTRIAICAFFLSHGVHHLQLGLRLLSLYRYRWDLLVLQLTGCIVILGLSFFASIESHSGVVLPSNGCVLLLDSSTLPERASLLILAGLSVCHQAFTTILAVVKLYQKYDPDNRHGLPQSIYTALMVDGIPYWIARLINVTAFFLLPIGFLVDNTLLLMIAFAIHTAIDVELSALILRSSPLCRKSDRRSSFGILGMAGTLTKGDENPPRKATLSDASRFSSMNLFPKEKIEQHASEAPTSSIAASVDKLPLYNHSLSSSKDWNQSENTLVFSKDFERIPSDQYQQPHQVLPRSKTLDVALTPPTRPPRTKSTRITQSLRTMLSSTSRYASVIHFYQDSAVPTPNPEAGTTSNWTLTRITPSRPPSMSTKSVSATPPPGWI